MREAQANASQVVSPVFSVPADGTAFLICSKYIHISNVGGKKIRRGMSTGTYAAVLTSAIRDDRSLLQKWMPTY